MINELEGDPRIREKFQIWVFFYDSRYLVPYSVGRLRCALANALHDFDPKGKDPALQRMVVIGNRTCRQDSLHCPRQWSTASLNSPIRAHSIIAVEGDGPKEDGDDGVVAYRSAHIDEAVSEKMVRWEHSCQDKPEAIEEVRRILLEHLAMPDIQNP